MSNLPNQPSASTIARNPHLYGAPLIETAKSVMERQPVKPRIRQSSKQLMNKLETECLLHLKSIEPYSDCWISQGIRFRLGNGIWYKPDLMNHAMSVVVEVKGPHAFRGGLENLKVAAGLYPWLEWWLMWKANSEWQQQIVKP